MKAVIQRVQRASVTVDGEIIASIGQGYLVLAGMAKGDTKETVDRITKKMLSLRIFADENGKTNRSIRDVNGSLLIVSQYTLCADTSHGNRPGFTLAERPERAEPLYRYAPEKLAQQGVSVKCGIFGADMKISQINDGPVTILLEF